MSTDTRILLFAKAPVAGQVKTRLIPHLTAQQALQLYTRLLDAVVNNLLLTGLPIDVWRAGDLAHPCWTAYDQSPQIRLFEQQGEDLGARMAAATQQALALASKVVLVGADCIDIDSNYINSAIGGLDNADVVIGPATDGGYVLLGLKRYNKALFSNINWGSEQVFAQTMTQLATLQWKAEVLPALHDIDRPEDLARLPSDFMP